MKPASVSGSFYRCVVFAALIGAVAAGISKGGVSKGAGPSNVKPTPSPSPTPNPPLCWKNPVQCCAGHTESDSSTAAAVLGRLGIPIPKEPVEIGFNCTSLSDGEVNEGFCGDSIFCCQKIYDGNLPSGKHAAVGVNCTDVAV